MTQAIRRLLLLGCWLAGSPAMAKDMVAVRPGVFCRSAEALARLTLPDGDSRTHDIVPRADDLRAASLGGCMDIPAGVTVTVRQSFRNTSIVTYRPAGSSIDMNFIAPNIDFQPGGEPPADPPAPATIPTPASVPVPAEKAAPAASADYVVSQRLQVTPTRPVFLEVLEDRRITPELRSLLWRNGRDAGGLPDAEAGHDFTRKPLLNAKLRLIAAPDAVLATRPLGFPLATIEAANMRGRAQPAFFLTIDETARGARSGLATEILLPADHGLRPIR